MAIVLIERDIPIIIHTGVGLPDELERVCPDVPVHVKPTRSDKLVDALTGMIREKAAAH